MRLAPRAVDLRVPLVAMTIAAAALLVIASFSKSWLVNSGVGDMGFGPTGFRGCLLGMNCDISSNGEAIAWLRENKELVRQARLTAGATSSSASGAFSPMGYLAFGATMLGAVGLLVTAVLAYRKERPQLPFSPARVALFWMLVGLFAGCAFVATKPGWHGLIGVGWGFWIFAIGIVAGIAGAQRLAKLIRPHDPLDALIPSQSSPAIERS